jgi:hypothetical protein
VPTVLGQQVPGAQWRHVERCPQFAVSKIDLEENQKKAHQVYPRLPTLTTDEQVRNTNPNPNPQLPTLTAEEQVRKQEGLQTLTPDTQARKQEGHV